LIFTNDANDPALRVVEPADVVVLTPKGGESYHNMWQKTRAAFMYLASTPGILDTYELFFFGGDDAFVIPENLQALMDSAPSVVTRQELETRVWGEELPDSDSLRVHIHGLRAAIDKPFDKPLIQTRHGIGYRMVDPDAVAA
jgi:hypothetical protein